jgi:hypothetical protein
VVGDEVPAITEGAATGRGGGGLVGTGSGSAGSEGVGGLGERGWSLGGDGGPGGGLSSTELAGSSAGGASSVASLRRQRKRKTIGLHEATDGFTVPSGPGDGGGP